MIEEKEYHKQINVVAKIVEKKPGLILDYEKITNERRKGKQEYEPNVGIIAEANATDIMIEMIIMSYNLWKIYLYGHLHDFEGMKITKMGYIEK